MVHTPGSSVIGSESEVPTTPLGMELAEKLGAQDEILLRVVSGPGVIARDPFRGPGLQLHETIRPPLPAMESPPLSWIISAAMMVAGTPVFFDATWISAHHCFRAPVFDVTWTYPLPLLAVSGQLMVSI